MSGPEWGEAETKSLRLLWDAGMSATEIGQRLGRSKNSVVGRVHRLHLTPRPSPIIRDGDPRRPYRQRRVVTFNPVTLPPLLSLFDDPILLSTPLPERTAPKPKPVVEVPRVLRESNFRCEWRDDDKPFVVRCGHKAVFGYPYCDEHCRRAYINWRGAVAEAA